jgi:hypothetical protein
MFIKFYCYACGHKLKAPGELAGRRARCTRCLQTIVVPPCLHGFTEGNIPQPSADNVPALAARVRWTNCNRLFWFRIGGVAAAGVALWAFWH